MKIRTTTAADPLFWILAISATLVCLVPFNYLPGLRLTLFGRSLPVHHFVFLLSGVILGSLSARELIRRQVRPPGFVLLSGIVAAALFTSSVLTPGSTLESLQVSTSFLCRGIFPAWAAYCLTNRFEREHRLFHVIVALGGLVAAGALYEAFTGRFFLFERGFDLTQPADIVHPHGWLAIGTVGHPLALSILMVLLFPLAAFQAVDKRSWYAGIVALLIATATAFAFRRTGLVLLPLAFISLFFGIKRSWRRFWGMVVGAAAIVVIGLALHPTLRAKIVQRFDPKANLMDIKSGHRTVSIRVATRMFLDHPIHGVGTGQYKRFYVRYRGQETRHVHPDNQYLHFAAEGGLLLVAPLLFLFGAGMVRLVRYRRDVRCWAYAVAIGFFLVNIAFADALFWPSIQMMFWIVFGMAMGRVDRLAGDGAGRAAAF